VISVTPLPLYPQVKSPQYQLEWRLSGPQSQSGQRGEEKILNLTGTRTPFEMMMLEKKIYHFVRIVACTAVAM
jgi:hypothetical protein